VLTSDFDYHLPPELIAQKPLPERDQSRMMVLNRETGEIIHSSFQEISKFLNKEDVLVLNNTRVIPAKAWGKKGNSEIEFLFLKEIKKGIWEVLCKQSRKVRLGDKILFTPEFEGTVIKTEPEGKRLIRFASSNVLAELKKIGYPPLPPYIKRTRENKKLRNLDRERYQTIFSREDGAIAAPTAGLHFTPRVLDEIKKKGVQVTEITLNVGLATFKPVRTENAEEHRMLAEDYYVSPKTAQTINKAIKESRSVVAVGSTVVRTLESAFEDGRIKAETRSTSLFIYPGYKFKVINRLLTNFHLPKSTLLMMVAAFAGLDFIKKAYNEAVSHRYRFYSYGDCMLIL